MNQTKRILLGLSIVALLVPVASLALPGALRSIWSWSQSDPAAYPAPLTAEQEVYRAHAHASDSNPEAMSSTSETDTSEKDSSRSPGGNSSTADSGQGPTSSSGTSPTTTASTNTTRHSHPTTTSSGSDTTETDGTLTGEACPCTVTGTVELKGVVNLRGDLVVEGGTLIARPDVVVNGHGFQIVSMEGGRLEWDGFTVNNVSRVMFHMCAGPSVLRNGTINDSGVAGELGFYPLHWHLNYDCTRGTLVENVTVRNGQNHAFVPHGSHGITFRDIKAFDTLDVPFWWDTPKDPPCSKDTRHTCTLNDSHDIVVQRALFDGVKPVKRGSLPLGYLLSGFQVGQGSGNSVTDTVVRNVSDRHSTTCSAYHWPSSTVSSWVFRNNRAEGGLCQRAIRVWQNLRSDDPQPVVEDFTSSHSINHGAYRNFYTYQRINVPLFVSHALSYAVRDSVIDQIDIRKNPLGGGEPVRFISVQVGSVIVSDRDGKAGTFIFEETNLTCAAVDMTNAHSGSEVVVNGESC